jgi:hypothetical protein
MILERHRADFGRLPFDSPIVGFAACGCNIWRTKVVVDV